LAKRERHGFRGTCGEHEPSGLRGSAEAQNTAAAQKVVPLPIPLKTGDPSLIQHVVYIIKENWTYDSLFGADPRGNGDPSLQMFGHEVIPNHQNLAHDFVLLDNFYSTGYSSQDGQSWMTQAFTTEYLLLPGYLGRGGDPLYGQDPLTFSKAGFLWDAMTGAGKTARVYGEFTGAPVKQHPDWSYSDLLNRWKLGQDLSGELRVTSYSKEMTSVTAPNYPGFYFDVPDVVRAQIFLHDLAHWNEAGDMPNFIFLELPLDHTEGNASGHPTAKAYLAGNDLALGQIVEGLSHSKFWAHMAIFVAEDDGFNALDHVDGRRVAALAISPYIRRGSVDSTFYSQTSMVKTIELIFGLKPMTLYDRIAPDMRNAFTTTPDLMPYMAEIPQQSLTEVTPKANAMNGKERAAALASARMDFTRPDAAPLDKLGRILWHSVRSWDVPYPATKRAVFVPMVLDRDGDDDDSPHR
jgi:Phosphoesterase family